MLLVLLLLLLLPLLLCLLYGNHSDAQLAASGYFPVIDEWVPVYLPAQGEGTLV